jgi:hypothetical protein
VALMETIGLSRYAIAKPLNPLVSYLVIDA